MQMTKRETDQYVYGEIAMVTGDTTLSVLYTITWTVSLDEVINQIVPITTP